MAIVVVLLVKGSWNAGGEEHGSEVVSPVQSIPADPDGGGLYRRW